MVRAYYQGGSPSFALGIGPKNEVSLGPVSIMNVLPAEFF